MLVTPREPAFRRRLFSLAEPAPRLPATTGQKASDCDEKVLQLESDLREYRSLKRDTDAICQQQIRAAEAQRDELRVSFEKVEAELEALKQRATRRTFEVERCRGPARIPTLVARRRLHVDEPAVVAALQHRVAELEAALLDEQRRRDDNARSGSSEVSDLKAIVVDLTRRAEALVAALQRERQASEVASAKSAIRVAELERQLAELRGRREPLTETCDRRADVVPRSANSVWDEERMWSSSGRVVSVVLVRDLLAACVNCNDGTKTAAAATSLERLLGLGQNVLAGLRSGS
eukprot:m51a1_g3488 hypothetical protein (292) ;mRNA; f:792127-793106